MIYEKLFSNDVAVVTPIPISIVENVGNSVDFVAIIALVISILSIVLTVLQYMQSQKLNDINMEAEYFREVFDEYILKKIPTATKKIEFINDSLSSSYKELSGVLIELKGNIGFFKYRNRNFYDDLIDNIYAIDDYLVGYASKKMSISEQKRYCVNLEKRISDLYTSIFNFYLGKRTTRKSQ